MKLKQILIFLFWVHALFASSQTFTFDPGDTYEAVLPMESYTDHYIYINHNSQDSAYISWRVVGNTCPEEWLVSICDWADCYSYLPNTGDMLPVGPGQPGFTKLTMNPLSIPGNGMIHFWIYPTGLIEEHVDMIYYFSTELVGIENKTSEKFIFPQPATDEIILVGFGGDTYDLLDARGNKVKSFQILGQKFVLPVSSLSSGLYLMMNSQGETFKILIQ
jgi:hypothetical protein